MVLTPSRAGALGTDRERHERHPDLLLRVSRCVHDEVVLAGQHFGRLANEILPEIDHVQRFVDHRGNVHVADEQQDGGIGVLVSRHTAYRKT